jgi:hypothetical protein
MESSHGRGSLQFDDAGHLLDEILCIKCAYNLRGMTLDGACPECGTAVGRSIKGDFLKFADPMWVSKLAKGMNWIIGAIIVSILMACVSFGIKRNTGDDTIPSILELASGLISIIGFWLLTSPDPGVTEPSPVNTRNLTRYSMLFAYVLTVLLVMLSQEGIELLGIALLILSGLLEVAAVFFCGFFAVGLAKRIPNKSLATQSKIVMIGMAVMYFGTAALAVIILVQINTITNTGSIPSAMVAVGAGALAVGVIGLIFSVWTLLLIIAFRNKLTQAATDARKSWASDRRTRVDIAQWEIDTAHAAHTTDTSASPEASISPEQISAATDGDSPAIDPDQWPDSPDSPDSQDQDPGGVDMSQWPEDPPAST